MNWKSFNIKASLGVFLLSALGSNLTLADEDEVTITDNLDFRKVGGMVGRLEAHGNDLMGDMIDKKTGSIVFSHTDIDIPGNSNLEVALRRKLDQGHPVYTPFQSGFGHWELDIPIAYFTYGYDDSLFNGAPTRDATTHPEFDNGCLQNYGNIFKDFRKSNSRLGASAVFPSETHIDGAVLYVPGKGLSGFEASLSTYKPPGSGLMDPKSDWVSGGQETDYKGRCAEVAIAPDGTKYKFGSHTLVRQTASVRNQTPYGVRISGDSSISGVTSFSVRRKHAVYLITEVEDVNGNWVRYEYTDDGSGELKRIYSNDDREINVYYDNVYDTGTFNSRHISHITANERTWRYEYEASKLKKVTLPDGRYWDFFPSGVSPMQFESSWNWRCAPTDRPFTFKHPDGALGTFVLRETRHLMSTFDHNISDETSIKPTDVPQPAVVELTSPNYAANFAACIKYVVPPPTLPFYTVHSVVKKTISGPNIPEATWDFNYRGYTGGDIDSTWTKITEPDGSERTYTYHTRRHQNGLLDKIDVVSPDGATESYDYEYKLAQGFSPVVHPDCYSGGALGDITATCIQFTKRPQTKITHTRDGTTYTTQREYDTNSDGTFKDYGRPNKITRKSTLQSEERISDITYWHNKASNIIGLPERISKNAKEFVYYKYNSKGQAEYVNKFGTRWDSFTYHPDGNLHTVTDARLNTATLTDYYRGQPRHIVRRDKTTLERTIDDNGWVTSETNGRGYTTSYDYTNGGWMNRITPPSPWEETNIVYHNLGKEDFYRSIRRGTQETVEWYDAMLRLRREGQQALSGGGLSTYVTTDYDALGRVVFNSLPSYSLNPTQGTNTSYDGLGRVTGTSENFGLGTSTSTEYLSNNRVKATDPLNNITITHRSGYGSPDDGQVTFIEQPEDVITRMDYDIFGNILEARQFHNYDDEASTQTWAYNDRLLPCVHHVPETGYKVFAYNDADQVEHYAEGLSGINADKCLSSIPSSSRITMGYDELGRTETINYPDTTPDVNIEYDANGNIDINERGGIVWDFDYNSADRLEAEVLSIDGRTYALNYGYDTMGNLDSRILPSGRVVEFGYNGLNQVTSVTSEGQSYASNINYHVNGFIANARYGNGHTFTQTINSSQQPERLRTSLALVTAMDLDYGYDERRDVTSIIDRVDRSRDRSMTYDDLGRLRTANGVWGSGLFSYDGLGNLKRKTLGNRIVSILYDETTNRARESRDTAGSTRAIGYDTRGNVAKLGSLNFTYDKSNQPVLLSGSSKGSYKYDGKFKRVKVDVDGKVIYNVFDASGTLVHVDEVVGGTANISVCFSDCSNVAVVAPQSTDYIKAGSVSIRLENDQPTYTHKDLLGSPVASTDALGNILWQEHYTPYGEKILRDAANDDQGSFTGHIADSATGLTYMQARYYDPVVGRFLGNDPVGFLGHLNGTQGVQGFNRYAYVNNNPYKFTDPRGEVACAGLCIGAAVASCAANPFCRGMVAAAGTLAADVVDAMISMEFAPVEMLGDAISNGVGAATGNIAAGAAVAFVGNNLSAAGQNLLDELVEGDSTDANTSQPQPPVQTPQVPTKNHNSANEGSSDVQVCVTSGVVTAGEVEC